MPKWNVGAIGLIILFALIVGVIIAAAIVVPKLSGGTSHSTSPSLPLSLSDSDPADRFVKNTRYSTASYKCTPPLLRRELNYTVKNIITPLRRRGVIIFLTLV